MLDECDDTELQRDMKEFGEGRVGSKLAKVKGGEPDPPTRALSRGLLMCSKTSATSRSSGSSSSVAGAPSGLMSPAVKLLSTCVVRD